MQLVTGLIASMFIMAGSVFLLMGNIRASLACVLPMLIWMAAWVAWGLVRKVRQ